MKDIQNCIVISSTLSKIKNSLPLSGKNPSFLANTFSISQIIDEVKKVKLLSYKGFSLSDRVVKKMDKVELSLRLEMLYVMLRFKTCGRTAMISISSQG